MRSWNLTEARIALEWASIPDEQRSSLEELAKQIGRSPKAVINFLRRELPPGHRPWAEKPRWRDSEAAAVQQQNDPELDGPVVRSAAAIRKYKLRNLVTNGIPEPEEDTYSVTEIAGALGLSRRTVYRMLARGQLRRWKGGVSEASFLRLVREHPELIPYAKLTREHREWLVLN
ncbi:MAG: helix-turn-helix domain-containing protein, partial [Bryobacteraceae bacterium]